MNFYCIQNGVCGVETFFSLLGSRWTTQIIELCVRTDGCTYSSLKKRLAGITDAALNRQLNKLIEENILQKKELDDSTCKFKYISTQKALDVLPTLRLMYTFSHECGFSQSVCGHEIEFVKKIIGSKWKSRIIWIVYHSGTMRFNELQRSIEGISFKVLAQQLKDLETDDIITKKLYEESILRSEYALTEKGEMAYQIIQSLAEWCHKYDLLRPRVTISL